MAEPMTGAKPIRDCDGCTLCCKVMKVEALEKPSGQWCPHCDLSKGCTIYETRPQECRTFVCTYLVDPDLDARWKPSEAKFVLVSDLTIKRLTAHVDPQRPDAWRREPYYSRFKSWSRSAIAANRQVAAVVGRRTWVILPDRDIDLGDVGVDEVIVTRTVHTPSGPRYEAYKLHRDDPRAANLRTT